MKFLRYLFNPRGGIPDNGRGPERGPPLEVFREESQLGVLDLPASRRLHAVHGHRVVAHVERDFHVGLVVIAAGAGGLGGRVGREVEPGALAAPAPLVQRAAQWAAVGRPVRPDDLGVGVVLAVVWIFSLSVVRSHFLHLGSLETRQNRFTGKATQVYINVY